MERHPAGRPWGQPAECKPIMKIGVDGGGTKTEAILVDGGGRIVARRRGPGCNPNVVGTRRAKAIVLRELRALKKRAKGRRIEATLLCMAGATDFWARVGAGLKGFGKVRAATDAEPVLELATGAGPGLVVHAGTGSFVAARSRSGRTVYAGGLGWRFGDEGSGYDLGRRAVARAILEMQGWAERSGLSALVARQTGLSKAREVMRHFYAGKEAHAEIAALAPAILDLAARGDSAARKIVAESVGALLDLAEAVAAKLFPGRRPIPAGLSGPILARPLVRRLAARRKSRLKFDVVAAAPSEGVRRMLR